MCQNPPLGRRGTPARFEDLPSSAERLRDVSGVATAPRRALVGWPGHAGDEFLGEVVAKVEVTKRHDVCMSLFPCFMTLPFFLIKITSGGGLHAQ